MNTRILIALTIFLGLMNPVAAIISTAEDMKNSEPGMLAAFALPWLLAAALLHYGKLTAGAIIAGLLSVLNLVAAPTWQHTTVANWTSQSLAAIGAAVCLVCTVTLLVQRHRNPVRLSG